MKKEIRSKLSGQRGISWITLTLGIAVVVLLVLSILPGILEYNEMGTSVACATALDTARRQLVTDFMMGGFDESSAEEAKQLVSEVMLGWDDLCPDYGTCYITHRQWGEYSWDVVCGLHDSDKKLCTRLNSNYVFDQIKNGVRKAQLAGNQYPESLTYTLHGKERTAYLVDAPTGLKWGTDLNASYDGIVAFYSIVGHSAFGSDVGEEDGTLWYFSYADENHCANWASNDGWTGDSYRGIE